MLAKFALIIFSFSLLTHAAKVPDEVYEDSQKPTSLEIIQANKGEINLFMSQHNLSHPKFGGIDASGNSHLAEYLSVNHFLQYQSVLTELSETPEIAFRPVVPGGEHPKALDIFLECVEQAFLSSIYKVSPDGIREKIQLEIYTFVEQLRKSAFVDYSAVDSYQDFLAKSLDRYDDEIDALLDSPDTIAFESYSELCKLLEARLPEFNPLNNVHNKMVDFAVGYMTHELLMYRSALDIFG